MKHEVKLGMTDYTVLVFIPDPASTDGSGKTGLVAANLTVSGTRVETDNDVTVTDYTSSLNDLSALTDAHNDWGLKEVSSTLAPGLYRLDPADAIFASGAWSSVVYVMITSSAAAASPMEFVLVPEVPLTGVVVASTVANAITATSIAADAITAAKIADGAIDAATFAASAITATAIASDAITAAKIADGAIDAATFAASAITATAIAADAITAAKIPDGAIDAATFAAGAITTTTFAAGAIDATAIAANAIGASELAADAVAEIADGILDRDMATGTDSGSTTVRTVRQALRFIRNKWSISGSTMTVTKEDDATTSWTATLSTTAGADPVTAVDPAGP